MMTMVYRTRLFNASDNPELEEQINSFLESQDRTSIRVRDIQHQVSVSEGIRFYHALLSLEYVQIKDD